MLVKHIARKLLLEFVVYIYLFPCHVFRIFFYLKWFLIEVHILHITATQCKPLFACDVCFRSYWT
jgi:hypothetical protein